MFNWFKKMFKKEMVSGSVEYQINDPATPDLKISVNVPTEPKSLKFQINGGTSTQRGAGCYITLANAINYFLNNKSLNNWAAVSVLTAFPEAGKMMNAYYDRQSLKFFYDKGPSGKMVYLVDSGDIVAHELGHAFLDATRPDFWNIAALEVGAMHEAFADVTAMVSVMLYEPAIDHALKNTGNDLRKSNLISELAEEMGMVLLGKRGLRNAINPFNYIEPEKIPYNTPDDRLGGECHSFGKVFLATWYDIFVGIYEYEKNKGTEPKAAVQKARDVAYKCFVDAISVAPRVSKLHEAVARGMLLLSENTEYHSIFENAFAKRNIIKPELKMLSFVDMNNVEGERVKYGSGTIVSVKNEKTIKLADHMPQNTIKMMSGIDLSQVEIEVPDDKFYVFNNSGAMTDFIESSEENVIQSANAVVSSITEVGPDSMWNVLDNKLVRNHII